MNKANPEWFNDWEWGRKELLTEISRNAASLVVNSILDDDDKPNITLRRSEDDSGEPHVVEVCIGPFVADVLISDIRKLIDSKESGKINLDIDIGYAEDWCRGG